MRVLREREQALMARYYLKELLGMVLDVTPDARVIQVLEFLRGSSVGVGKPTTRTKGST